MRSDSSSSITGFGGARPKQHSRSTGSKRSSFCSEGDGGGGVGYPGGNQSWGGVPSIEMDDPENSAEYAAMDFNTASSTATGTAATRGSSTSAFSVCCDQYAYNRFV